MLVEEDSLLSDREHLTENTIKFCGQCRNILNPSVDEDLLTYSCEKKLCDFKMVIKGTGQFENLVSKIEN